MTATIAALSAARDHAARYKPGHNIVLMSHLVLSTVVLSSAEAWSDKQCRTILVVKLYKPRWCEAV